ncbi:MAG: hypothetical protein M3Q56_07275 [Bacteroidota bacterium]|nr:hypothetical protein [Bacteroidota bacterium]
MMGLFDRIKAILGFGKDAYVPSIKKNDKEYLDDTSYAPENHAVPEKVDKTYFQVVKENEPEVDLHQETLLNKTGEFISETAQEVKEQSAALWEVVKDKAQDIEEGTREYREKIANTARAVAEKVENIIDKTVEKAKTIEQEESKMDKDKDGLADKPIDFGENLTDKHGELFDKAASWLEKNKSENSIEANDPPAKNDVNNERLELPKEE